MSGMEMTSAIHDDEPVAEASVPDKPWRPERIPSTAELLGRAGMNNAARPMHAGRVLSRAVPQLGRLQRQLRQRTITPPPTNIPRTRWSGPVTAHRVFDAVGFELADLRRMKETVPGATINDVVLTIVGGGLRSYLQDKGELPDDPLIAMAPISVRTRIRAGRRRQHGVGDVPDARHGHRRSVRTARRGPREHPRTRRSSPTPSAPGRSSTWPT